MIRSVLLTGASGGLGKLLRPALTRAFEKVRLSDIVAMDEGDDGAELAPCDLRDRAAVERLAVGMDAIVHLGGSLSVNDWDVVRDVNIDGTFNVYEAARLNNVVRVVYASSNHVIGMYPREESIGLSSPLRPDSLYGVSKCFGEALSRYYYDKFGIESACLRIGSALAKPNDERALATWLSLPDLEQLVLRCLTAPILGWTALYGASNNDRSWWSNDGAGHVGFRPRDNAEDYAAEILAAGAVIDAGDPKVRFQGGARSAHGYVEEAERPLRRRARQAKP